MLGEIRSRSAYLDTLYDGKEEMKISLKQIIELAGRATPGPFHIGHISENDDTCDVDAETIWFAENVRSRDALYLCAASPDVVKKMAQSLQITVAALEEISIKKTVGVVAETQIARQTLAKIKELG